MKAYKALGAARFFMLVSFTSLSNGMALAENDANASDSVVSSLFDRSTTGSLPDAPSFRTSRNVDVSRFRHAIASYQKGDKAAGDIAISSTSDPVARGVAEWVALRSNDASFSRIASFLNDYGDWPAISLIRRKAEEALINERASTAQISSFFAGKRPVSAFGKYALATVLKAQGHDADAASLIRDAWRNDSFGADLENKILDSFSLGRADHRARMERLLFKESYEGALRSAKRAGADYVALAKARMAIGRKASNAAALIRAIPASLHADSSYIFARAQNLRRSDQATAAAESLQGMTKDPSILVDGDEWWNERRLIARKLLDDGHAKLAYQVVKDHAAQSNPQRIEAEFHAGWIALRFLNDPQTASRHFAQSTRLAETPISVARTAYWQGRANEAMGSGDAHTHYQKAASQTIAYYGQLARAKLGLTDLPLRAGQESGAGGRSSLDRVEGVQAIRLLSESGNKDLAIPLYNDLAQKMNDGAQLDALGDLAQHYKDARALVTIGKAAVQRGYALDLHAYPTIGIPAFDPLADNVEKAMVYAITRQESVFDPKATSSAGAKGLMQLMPATARMTAQKNGLGFDASRLTSDPAYNARLGSAHLGELIDRWNGSYILTIAAYNAGSGNVKKWVEAYGDPRSSSVDPIDWVERIPFSETRNYVQRVMENLQIYRARLGQRSALLIENDLRRGAL